MVPGLAFPIYQQEKTCAEPLTIVAVPVVSSTVAISPMRDTGLQPAVPPIVTVPPLMVVVPPPVTLVVPLLEMVVFAAPETVVFPPL